MIKKLRNLLLVAIDLQSSSVGLTKKDILEKCNDRGFSPSLRTVERWLDELNDLGLEIENNSFDTDHHNLNRYKIKNLPKAFMNLTNLERSSLERISMRLSDQSEKQAISKVIANQPFLSNAILNDLSELIENTHYTGNVSPSISVNEKNMANIEKAIQGLEIINFEYENEDILSFDKVEAQPLGFLFGRFGYLICISYKKQPMTYRLDLIHNVENTGKIFQKPKDFNFKEFANNSFGVFQGEKVLDIKIWFDKKIANRVSKIKFHSTQIMKKNNDGSLVLSLHCSGYRELIWELFHPDYIGQVKILEPDELIKEAKEYVSKINKVI